MYLVKLSNYIFIIFNRDGNNNLHHNLKEKKQLNKVTLQPELLTFSQKFYEIGIHVNINF